MIIDVLRVFAILCVAAAVGKAAAKIKLPAILGWLVTGVAFGPYLAGIVTAEIINGTAYQIFIKILECCAGVMIGREIVFKKIARSGRQIAGITIVQSLGTFLFVTLCFAAALPVAGLPLYTAPIFGGIALATAPAPALSVVHEYRTKGPVTDTLIPLAAIDDVIGVIVFFTVISVVGAVKGGQSVSVLATAATVVLPFVAGIGAGVAVAAALRGIKRRGADFAVFLAGLVLSAAIGLCIDLFLFRAFRLNYLLIGMSYSAAVANFIEEERLEAVMKPYAPILNVSLLAVIVNLGMPLDYRLIAGAGVFTCLYIVSRAAGKIGFSYLGAKWTHAAPTVKKYLGLTLLPHSGVSLVFTGIICSTLASAPQLVRIVQGTIAAAAVINEFIAVIAAKKGFELAGEIPKA
ncbi:MAG: cation:proton antiporter [Candidatus Scatosoma sp.]